MFGLNFLRIYSNHVRATNKTILISAIGLLFALSILASTMMYVDSTRNYIFSDALKQDRYTDEDISFYYYSSGMNINSNQITETISESITNYLNSTKIDQKIHTIYSKSSINGLYTSVKNNVSEYNFTNNEYYWVIKDINMSVGVFEINEAIKSELSSLAVESSAFPTKINDSFGLFIKRNNYYNSYFLPNLNDNKSLLLPEYAYYNINQSLIKSFNYTLTGIGEIDQSFLAGSDIIYYQEIVAPGKNPQSKKDTPYPILYDLSKNQYFDIFYFVPNITAFSFKLGDTFNFINEFDKGGFINYNYQGFLNFDYTKIDSYNLVSEIKIINKFITQVRDDLFSKLNVNFNSYFDIYFNSEYLFNQVIAKIDLITMNLLVFTTPILFVTLILVFYSFNLNQRSLERKISIYKLRGLQNGQTFIILALDSFASLFLALFGSLLLGQLITTIVLKTDSIWSFNSERIINLTVSYESLSIFLFIAGILLTFISNSIRIFKLVRKEEINFHENNFKKSSFVKKYFIDVIGLIFGLIAVFLYTEQLKNRYYSPNEVFTLLGVLGVFFSVTGLLFLVIRIYSFTITKITDFSWNRFGGLFSLALKNVISLRYLSKTTNTIILLVLITATSITFITLPYSTIQWKEKNLAYEIGAEGRGTLFSGSNELFNATLDSILENNLSSYFDSLSYYMKFQIRQNYNGAGSNDYGTILAVNTTSFLNSTIIPISLGTTHELAYSLDQLNVNNSDTILMHSDVLEYRESVIGSNISIKGSNQNGDPVTSSYKIIDKFDFWPTLYFKSYGYDGPIVIDEPYIDYQDSKPFVPVQKPSIPPIYGIVSLNYFTRPNMTLANSSLNILEKGYFFNFKENTNVTLLGQILNNYSISLQVLDVEMNNYLSDMVFLVSIGQMNANLIVNIFMTIALLIIFAIVLVTERKKELTTEKSLGMKQRHTQKLLFYESLIIIGSGLIIGNVLGVIVSKLMSLFVVLQNTTIDYELLLPLDLIFNLEIILIIMAGIQIVFTIWLLARTPLSVTLLGDD
jgi:hypothetical protein